MRRLEEASNFLEIDAIRASSEFLATLTYGEEAEPGRRGDRAAAGWSRR